MRCPGDENDRMSAGRRAGDVRAVNGAKRRALTTCRARETDRRGSGEGTPPPSHPAQTTPTCGSSQTDEAHTR